MNATCPPKTPISHDSDASDSSDASDAVPPNSPETSFLLPTSEGAHSTKSSPLPILVGQELLESWQMSRLCSPTCTTNSANWLQLEILSVHAKTLNLQPAFFAEDVFDMSQGLLVAVDSLQSPLTVVNALAALNPLPSQSRETVHSGSSLEAPMHYPKPIIKKYICCKSASLCDC